MSFYIEIKNWNAQGPKTFLVNAFNPASKRTVESKGIFGTASYGPDPDATEVVLNPGGFREAGAKVEIAVGYEAFKKALLSSQAANDIPSFTCTKKTDFGSAGY